MNNTGDRNADIMLKDHRRLTRELRGFASERVTGRKAGAPNGGNRLQVSDIFFFSLSLLNSRRKLQVSDFIPLLYTKLKGGFP